MEFVQKLLPLIFWSRVDYFIGYEENILAYLSGDLVPLLFRPGTAGAASAGFNYYSATGGGRRSHVCKFFRHGKRIE